MNVLNFNKYQDGAERVSAVPHSPRDMGLAETSAPHEPGLSVIDLRGTQCEEEDPVGMVLRETRRPPTLLGSETPTGNTFLEKVRAGTIECAECGGRAQMRCGCGVLVCLRHVYDIDGDPYCATCVASLREERHIQDELTLEMYKNIARRR